MNPFASLLESARLSRRHCLQVGALSGAGISLETLAAVERTGAPLSGAKSFGRAKRCVILFLTGGMPQHDTLDPKPLAPANVRGELSPIATNVPGVHVSELFPQFAQRMDRVTLVRSVTHDDTVHTSAGYTMLTGWKHTQANAKTAADIRPQPTDHPHVGSILSLVTVYWHYEGPDDSPVWDTHWNNFAHLRNRLGAYPADHPVSPNDLAATVLHLLGVSPELDLYDPAGRPHRACDGSSVWGLLSESN